MILLSILVDAVRAQREMRGSRRVTVSKAAMRAANNVAFELRGARGQMGEIQKQWNRRFTVRNKRFPSAVLRVRLATLKKPVATVRNVAQNDLLRQQIRGGIRRAKESRALLVPKPSIARTPTGRVRKTVFRNTVSKGKYLFSQRKTGPDVYIGVLTPQAKIDKGFPLRPLVRFARRRFVREFRRLSRREARRFAQRGSTRR